MMGGATSVIPHRPSYEVKSTLWTVMVLVNIICLAIILLPSTSPFKDIEKIFDSFAFYIKKM
jgi:hypothetical protein